MQEYISLIFPHNTRSGKEGRGMAAPEAPDERLDIPADEEGHHGAFGSLLEED